MAARGEQYLLPQDLGVAAASEALADRLKLKGGPTRSLERTFYDTFDGRLHEEGLVLVHEGDALALLASAGYNELASADAPATPDRVLVAELPPGGLRERLAPVVEVRALTPIARVRSRVRRMSVLDGEAKTLVRLAVEEPSVKGDGRARVRLRERLVVSPVRGYDSALADVNRTLEREMGFEPAAEPLHDAAVLAAGGTPGGVSSKPRVSLRPRQRADTAAVEVLTRLLTVIEANVPGTIAATDTEFLHDLRVAVRRSRSVQRQLRGVFPPQPLERFRAEFRRLQQVTGPSRDLDVYLLEFDELRSSLPVGPGQDLYALEHLLAERRRAAHRRMVRALRAPRTAKLLEDWAAFLDRLVALPEDDRPDAARAVTDVAGRRIHRVYRRLVRMGSEIDDGSPAEALHEMRKRGKELRYLLEFFGGLYPDDVAEPMVKTLKSLQSTLGRFQDRQVQAEMLRSVREDVATRGDGAAALMAMGLLVERLGEEQRAARAEFADRFADFSAKRRRRLVERTFG